MIKPFSYTLTATDPASAARAGTVQTLHGSFNTPAFMPVGTLGTVKSMSPAALKDTGAEIILSNTYHLYLRPGEKLINKMGGLHEFMGWDGPILTDSGGFQVFSLAALRKIEKNGVSFQSHWDGSKHYFTPEKVIAIQKDLGIDIMMCFDECTPYPAEYEYAARSNDITVAWAKRCMAEYRSGGADAQAALFGIVQGSTYENLRRECAQALVELDFPGYAIGGLSVGEPKEELYKAVDIVAPLLPADRPRYVMGLGTPRDLVKCVARGIDMFDCVIPTRNGRNGTVFTRVGKLVLKNAKYKEDNTPIDAECNCYTCRTFSRAYLRHLFQCKEMLGPHLATLHNIHFFQDLMRDMRNALAEGTFSTWMVQFLGRYPKK